MTTELTSDTYDEFINSAELPVIVDFWAPWCKPCLQIAPIIDELATEMQSEITFAKLNIEDFPEFGKRYEILSIPALLVIKNDLPHVRVAMNGGFNKERMIESIRKAVNETTK
jgi:thioredoxin 1